MAKYLSIEVELFQVRVAEVEQGKKYTRVRHCFCFPTPQGAVEDSIIRDTHGLGVMLKKELNSRKIKTKKVFFAVGSTRIASREVRIPFVKKNRIQSIVDANATDYFPIDTSKYVLSYCILNTESVNSEKVDEQDEKKKKKAEEKQYHMMVYAAPKSISAAYREFAQVAGLNMVGFTYTGDAVYHAVKEEFAKKTYVLVKIEEQTTGIAIVKEGELALQRIVNYGVDNAVDTLRSFPEFGQNLDTREALDILCSRKCICPYLDMDPEITEPEDTDEYIKTARREITESLRYLIGNISRIMDYFISRNPDVSFENILCCGIGPQVLGMTELLSHELGLPTSDMDQLHTYTFGKNRPDEGLSPYIAVLAPNRSGVNLMENIVKKQKDNSLSGSILVFFVGLLAAAALIGSSMTVRLYQEHERDRLNEQIDEASAIEAIFNEYNLSKEQFENYQVMYQYTETPNEGLVEFIEEMEKKMPSDITVETFSSSGTQVSFSMRLSGKSQAANTLMQLRTFDSLMTVTTTGIDEAEDGTVSMSVTCTYRNPAVMDSAR